MVEHFEETYKAWSAKYTSSISCVRKTFLPPDAQTYVCVSGGKKVSFSEIFAYVLNGWSHIWEYWNKRLAGLRYC